MAQENEFEGTISLALPMTDGKGFSGWSVQPSIDGNKVSDITRIDLHFDAELPTWADVMFLGDSERHRYVVGTVEAR